MPGRLDAMLALLDRTEANAMVIDVKETDGKLFWATDLPEAVAAGSVRENPVFDLEELLPALKERGIYTIARMVVDEGQHHRRRASRAGGHERRHR